MNRKAKNATTSINAPAKILTKNVKTTMNKKAIKAAPNILEMPLIDNIIFRN